MLLAAEGRVIPGIEVRRPDGTSAQFSLYTDKDKQLVEQNAANGGPASLTLEEIAAAKQMIALDASDGKLDFKVNGLELERPRYTIFWTDNSAAVMMRALLEGGRSLRINGKEVEVTQAFKAWVNSTQFLESVPAGGPIGG